MGWRNRSIIVVLARVATSGMMESSWSRYFPSNKPPTLSLLYNPFRSGETSPFKKSMFMVSVPLPLQTVVRRKLRVLYRDVPRPTAEGTDEMYMRGPSFKFFEKSRLELLNEQKKKMVCKSGMPNLVRKPSCPRTKDHEDNQTVPRDCSAYLSTHLEVQWVRIGSQIASCGV